MTPLSLGFTPHGHLHLTNFGVAADEPVETDRALPERIAKRIAEAFAHGAGHGVLHLGAVELTTELPADFAFARAIGKQLMTSLCAIPDLESARATLALPVPAESIAAWASAVPPMDGAEYCSHDALAALWLDVVDAARQEFAAFDGTATAWLQSKNPAWHHVGRVWFHLAENKRNPSAPFAFLATYTSELGAKGQAQHVPLGRALETYSGTKNRAALLSLLGPVKEAATRVEFVRALVDSGEIYHPIAWSPDDAHRFLRSVTTLEECGVLVRVPDWWNARKPPRPRVSVSVGSKEPSRVGIDALLDFSVSVALEGETLSPAELKTLLAGHEGLALLKGRWVEVDRDELREVLDHWNTAQQRARNGLSFAEAMRLVAGVPLALDASPEEASAASGSPAQKGWTDVIAGPWMREVLAGLRDPHGLGDFDPGESLKASLRDYQRDGVRWLWWLYSLGLGGVLADDMGLGKTIQVLALLLLMKRRAEQTPNLLVVPASLIANWQGEAARFAPALKIFVAHTSSMTAQKLAALEPGAIAGHDLVITTYGSLARVPCLTATKWNLVVLDEAQAIKNSGSKQTRAVKALASRRRLSLTGTPVENRLGDLWSQFDFVAPGLLGSEKAFGRFAKRLADANEGGFAPLRNLVRPYILRRLKTDRTVIADLPDKTEVVAYCGLSRKQAALYAETVATLAKTVAEAEGIERRGVVLASLVKLKQICNHPAHAAGVGEWSPDDSGKFARLAELCESIASRQEKVLVFTQFREATAPIAEYLERVFGRRGLVLHGDVAVKKRKELVDAFQREDGPPFFVLSLKAGGTGLNLTAASHVIHFDRWWNPAVENQATDRAFRIGQKRNVLVHKFVCRGTVEERIDALISSKQALSNELLGGTSAGEVSLTELGNDELLRLVSLDLEAATGES